MNTVPLSIRNADIYFEKGYRADRGAVKVVDLHGTWYEMGRQYGALLREELRDVVGFVEHIMKAGTENAVAAEAICDAQVRQMSYNIRRFFEGAAQTSGLTLRQMHYAHSVEYIAGLPQCSAIAAWGDYVQNHRLVFGRNYDYGEIFLTLSRDVAVTVFHPADGSLATAIVGYAGEIYCVNGMNEKGIFLELNNGTPSTGVAADVSRIYGTSGLFDVLFKADTLDYLERFFRTTLCDDSYIINAADGSEARSYEWCQTGMLRGDGCTPKGLMVSTNHYVHPDWPYPVPDDAHSWRSITRRKQLLKLGTEEKGRINADCMMKMLDRRLEDGGTTDELTIYQLVVEPELLSLRLKITDACDWTNVDLGSFMKY